MSRIHADFYTITQALRLVDPVTSNYLVKWPIYGSNFNTRDYNSIQMLLSDLEALISITLLERFNIQSSEFKVIFVSTALAVIKEFLNRIFLLFWSSLTFTIGDMSENSPTCSSPQWALNNFVRNRCVELNLNVLDFLYLLAGISGGHLWCWNLQRLCSGYWCSENKYRMCG